MSTYFWPYIVLKLLSDSKLLRLENNKAMELQLEKSSWAVKRCCSWKRPLQMICQNNRIRQFCIQNSYEIFSHLHSLYKYPVKNRLLNQHNTVWLTSLSELEVLHQSFISTVTVPLRHNKLLIICLTSVIFHHCFLLCYANLLTFSVLCFSNWILGEHAHIKRAIQHHSDALKCLLLFLYVH